MKKYITYLVQIIWVLLVILMCPWITWAGTKGEACLTMQKIAYEERNPLYEETDQDMEKEGDDQSLWASHAMLYSLEDPVWSDDSPYDLEQIQTIGVAMRQSMVARETSIATVYETRELVDDYRDLAAVLFAEAVKHTGVPMEGDYLRWQYVSYKITGNIARYVRVDEDGNYIKDEKGDYIVEYYAYNFNWELAYYTDVSMESQVDAKVEQLVEEELPLKAGHENDVYNIGVVYDYICSHVTYDYENLPDEDYKEKYTAYAALFDGRAVCQGYSNLMYRMLLELGIDCRLVSGKGDGEAHGWNIVKVEDMYYNLDSTWDAGKDLYSWYLKGDKDFTRHLRDREYRTDEFNGIYPMSYSGYSDTCEHEYADIHKDPTCSREGCDLHTCIYCKEGERENVIPQNPTAHHYKSQVYQPTCVDGGYTVYTCEYCRDVYQDDEIPAIGHIPGTEVREHLIPATLESEGSYDSVVYCLVCEEELARNPITLPRLETFYTIRFDANGGKGTMSDMELTYSQKKKLTANAYTKTGYSFNGWQAYRSVDKRWYAQDSSGFKGWYTNEDIKALGYSYYVFVNKASVQKLTGYMDAVITMKAQWKANTYTLVFEPNRGSGSMKNQKFTYGVEKKIKANAFTRKGYKFAGWKCYRESDGKWYTDGGWKTKSQIKAKGYAYKLVENKATIKKSSAVNGDRIICYAQWKK